MQATINTKDFISSLRKVMLASSKQALNNELANAIKLSVSSNNCLILTSYNFSVAIESSLDANDCEEGDFCVNAKSIFDIISKCVSEFIHVSFNGTVCTIKSGKAVFNLPAMSSDNFALLPKVGDIKPITIDAVRFVESANKVLYAAAQDDKRPELQGVSVEIQNEELNLVACDAYRLANVKFGVESDRELKIIVPSGTVSILSKIVKDSNDDAQIFASNKFIMVKVGNATLTSRLVSGIYMDWRKAIPDQIAIDCVFEKNKIVRAIEMAQAVQSTTGKTTGCIVFEINKDIANISLKSQAGQFEDQIEFETNGNLKMKIAFNTKYLLDAIRTIDQDKVTMSIIGSLSPCFIKGDKDDSIMNMVLPVRIK